MNTGAVPPTRFVPACVLRARLILEIGNVSPAFDDLLVTFFFGSPSAPFAFAIVRACASLIPIEVCGVRWISDDNRSMSR
eukprot:5942215-Prymnesium_polylepis.1